VNSLPLPVDLVRASLVYDGSPFRQGPPYGNFLGLVGVPPGGGWYWVAENGDHGKCGSEDEARRELEEAWGR